MPRPARTRQRRGRRRVARRARRITRKMKGGGGPVQKAWIITIEPEGARAKHVVACAQAAGVPFEVWKGVNGKELNPDMLPSIGIGKVIFKSRQKAEREHHRNLGSIGCFLSHRTLYEKIVAGPDADDTLYAILEDDITFGPDFQARIAGYLAALPANWDLLYLSKGQPTGKKVAEGIIRLEKRPNDDGNFGTWAFLVRKKFLREFMLPLLAHMYEELDGQINQHFDRIQAYCVDPPYILTQEGAGSQIQAMD